MDDFVRDIFKHICIVTHIKSKHFDGSNLNKQIVPIPFLIVGKAPYNMSVYQLFKLFFDWNYQIEAQCVIKVKNLCTATQNKAILKEKLRN